MLVVSLINYSFCCFNSSYNNCSSFNLLKFLFCISFINLSCLFIFSTNSSIFLFNLLVSVFYSYSFKLSWKFKSLIICSEIFLIKLPFLFFNKFFAKFSVMSSLFFNCSNYILSISVYSEYVTSCFNLFCKALINLFLDSISSFNLSFSAFILINMSFVGSVILFVFFSKFYILYFNSSLFSINVFLSSSNFN